MILNKMSEKSSPHNYYSKMAKKKCQTIIQNDMKSNMSMEGFKSISRQRIKILTGSVKIFFLNCLLESI